VVNDSRPEAAERAAIDVEGHALPFSAADSAAVAALAGLSGRWGRLNVLVNNAGIEPNPPEEERRRTCTPPSSGRS
jgi:NAD(P)-dependent dehydrogenase (short-subunit alcohol dehydrogenase family)